MIRQTTQRSKGTGGESKMTTASEIEQPVVRVVDATDGIVALDLEGEFDIDSAPTILEHDSDRARRAAQHRRGGLELIPPAGSTAPAAHLVDRDVGDLEPASAVGALDPDAWMPLQGAPFRLLFLSDAEQGGRDLNDAGCR